MEELVCSLCTTKLEGALGLSRGWDTLPGGELVTLVEAARAVLVTSSQDEIVSSGAVFVACAVGLFPVCFAAAGPTSTNSPPAFLMKGARLRLAEALITDINQCLKRLQQRHCLAIHAAKMRAGSVAASNTSEGETKRPLWSPFSMEVMVASGAIAAVLRIKSLIMCVVAATVVGEASTLRKLLPSLFEAPSALHWVGGSAGLEQAESEFDFVTGASVGSKTVGSLAQLALLEAGPRGKDDEEGAFLRSAPTPYVACCCLPLAPSPQPAHMELKRSWSVDLSSALMFDSEQAPISTALRNACRNKLLGDQADGFIRLMTEVATAVPSVEATCRIEALRRFLHAPPLVAQLVEKNKDAAVALITLRSRCISSGNDGGIVSADFTVALQSMIELVEVGEPLCHVVKGLSDVEALYQAELELFVLTSIRKIEADQARGDEPKYQRSSKLLALLLNNLLLRRRERIVSPEVEAALCDLLVRTTRVRECAELYGTLCAVRKQHPAPF